MLHDVGPVDDWGAVGAAVSAAATAALGEPTAPVAHLGVADGAYLAALAAAYDPRAVALVCDPGAVRPGDDVAGQLPDDVTTPWVWAMPRPPGPRSTARSDPAQSFGLAKVVEAWPHLDAVAVLDRLRNWDLANIAERIRVPTIVTEAAEATSFAGQSRELVALLGRYGELVTFSADEGAGLDCEIGAPARRAQQIFDRLERHLA